MVENYEIQIDKLKLKADLIVLDTYDYDVILGMNWLGENKVVIDCHNRQLIIPSCIPYNLDKSLELAMDCQIEVLKQMALESDYECLELNDQEVANELRQIPIVQDFPEVFPTDLPRLPSLKEV